LKCLKLTLDLLNNVRNGYPARSKQRTEATPTFTAGWLLEATLQCILSLYYCTVQPLWGFLDRMTSVQATPLRVSESSQSESPSHSNEHASATSHIGRRDAKSPEGQTIQYLNEATSRISSLVPETDDNDSDGFEGTASTTPASTTTTSRLTSDGWRGNVRREGGKVVQIDMILLLRLRAWQLISFGALYSCLESVFVNLRGGA